MIRRLPLALFIIFSVGTALSGHAAPGRENIPKPRASTSQSSAKKEAATPSKKGVPEPFAADTSGRAPQVHAASAILVDAKTGEVLYESNVDERRPVASTQKLMTALLVIESGNLGEKVSVQESDTMAEPSKLYIKRGETYPRLKLLQVLMVKSMNDVARCLGRDNAGSLDAFARRMNSKAEELGMASSHFVNPNGLPASGQYSTARDMAKLGVAAYRNKTLRGLTSLKTLTWQHPDGRVSEFTNTNRVLANYALCNGLKTGYTEAAGFCLVSSAAGNGREVVSVLLGSKKEFIWTDSYRLLSWGISKGR